jgi:hypothetical protein
LLLLHVPACRADAAQDFHARIGESVVVLTGPWRFHPGDDPAWAQPSFNDASWDTMDFTPPNGSYDPTTGSSGFVPGWTAHSQYRELSGFAWYRLRIQLENETTGSAPAPLALVMPLNFDDAYQVYVNGQEIGEFGRFKSNHVVFFNSQPRSFALPDSIHGGGITIAIRLWMDPGTRFQGQDAGGLHGPPILGRASSVDSMLRLEWDKVNRSQVGNVLSGTFLVLAALMGFTLYWFDRHESAYLWLGLACLLAFVNRAMVVTGYYTAIMPMVPEVWTLDVLMTPLSLGLWALFWAYWFRLDITRMIARYATILVVLLAFATSLIRAPLFGSVVPVEAASWLLPLSMVIKLLLGALLVWVTYRGIRQQASGGWLALTPVLLTVLWAYQEELQVVHVPTILRVFGLTITVGQVSMLLMLAIISFLMMKRFVRGQRERELWRQEIEQAREVQQVLIPETIPSIPGFLLASEYRPAQQVGGDFFQIVPIANGGVLAVIGDVSGKGMPAAMTVSLLVGTLRTLAHFTDNPGDILAAMNIRMLARTHGGFTTCLVMRVTANGMVTVANAGHLSPYLNGTELTVEAGLPLGLSADTAYPESTFHIRENEQLTLISDGVVEARGTAGELFGFDRTATIATKSAEEIAATAQTFGQEDDITVLTVMRVAAGEEAATKVAARVMSLAEGTV